MSWAQALAWRLRQHFLDPIGSASVPEVVHRLGAVAQADTTAELAIRLRRRRSTGGEVARALAEGRIIKAFALRGAVHLMSPANAAANLALRAASRMWELPSWQSYYSVTPGDWDALRDLVREALSGGPLTRAELGRAVTAHRRFRHLGFAFADNAGTFLKPLCWQGVMSFGPPRDGRATFQGLDGNPHWKGLLELDEAGRRAVESYIGAYGPATADHLRYWLAEGLGAGRKRVLAWIGELGDRISEVDVGGQPAYLLRDDVEAVRSTSASSALRLLPGYDQWVLGPGTSDVHIVPPARRALVSRQAAIVIAGGVVSGTWSRDEDVVSVSWFREASAPRRPSLKEEVARVGRILGRNLDLDVRLT